MLEKHFSERASLQGWSIITNLDGEIVQHIEYVPFGEVFIEERNKVWNTPYLFNGKELDEETGLYYYGARYYNPRESVWLSVDPLAGYNPIMEVEHYIDGQHNGGVYNAMNLNVYGYTYQNPVLYIDPNGKQTVGKVVGKVLGRTILGETIGGVIGGVLDIPTTVLGAILHSTAANGGEAQWAREKFEREIKEHNLRVLTEKESQLKDGAERAEKYSEGWSEGSLKDTRNKVAPNSEGEPNEKGTKTIYKNEKTGKQVVYDKKGNYFRVEDTNNQGARKYLDKNGNPVPNNKTLPNGKQQGKTKSEYQQETHFRNTDK